MEGVDHRRAAPQVPVEVVGGDTGTLEADAAAWLAAVAVGDLEFAELAGVDHLVEAGDLGVAAALGAVLDHHAVFLLRLDRDASFVDVVAHRLLDVDVLAALRTPDGHQRVPMVRRRHGDGVDVLVGDRVANVRRTLRLVLALAVDFVDASGDGS